MTEWHKDSGIPVNLWHTLPQDIAVSMFDQSFNFNVYFKTQLNQHDQQRKAHIHHGMLIVRGNLDNRILSKLEWQTCIFIAYLTYVLHLLFTSMWILFLRSLKNIEIRAERRSYSPCPISSHDQTFSSYLKHMLTQLSQCVWMSQSKAVYIRGKKDLNRLYWNKESYIGIWKEALI